MNLKPLNKQKHAKAKILINQLVRQQNNLFRQLARQLPELDKTLRVNDGQWGYIPSTNWAEVLLVARQLKINSLIDLGCGLCFGLSAINFYQRFVDVRENIILGGIELDPSLFKLSQSLTNYGCDSFKLINKNLLALEASDVEEWEGIYMYEPFSNLTSAAKFLELLISKLQKKHIIILQSTGGMAAILQRHPLMQEYRVKDTALYIFTLKQD